MTDQLETTAVVVREQPGEPMLAVIERAARDPQVDVAKMERLLEMAEKIHQRQAQAAFDSAMNACQTEMRPVARDSDNPQTRSRYASYGALDQAVRPIYSAHGFALSFGTRSTTADRITVTCHVSHRAGFARDVEIDMPSDGKGAKGGDVMTKTHATGSAVSYGMRYLLKMIFNIALGEYDDDGNAAGGKTKRADTWKADAARLYPHPPASAKKPIAERIIGLQHKLGPVAGHALEYLRSHGTDGNENSPALMPNEGFSDLSEAQVDFLAKNWAAFMTWLQAWTDRTDQVPGAEVDPSKHHRAPAPAPKAITNPHVTGKIEAVSVKEGTSKKGKPYTKYGIKINGEWVNSFSGSIGTTAEDLKGEEVTIEFKETDFGKEAIAITDDTGNTVSIED